MTAISADQVNALNLLANAIQRRINFLCMTKVNFVRSRTGILFRVSAWSKLQKQLAQAQRALADERSSHGATEDFLQHQSNARADREETIEQLRAEVEELKAKLAAEESGLGEDAQTGEAEETDVESPAADEINSPPTQTADESAHTIARLRKELEDLQAEYEELEGQRDTWRDTAEEWEVKVEDLAGEKEDHERRIGDLETQLDVERTSREEAQAAVGSLRDQNEKLRQELQESKAQHETLRTAYQEEERANEERAAELTSLRAECDRLWDEVTGSRRRATSSLDGSAPEFVPSASPSSSLNGSAPDFVPSASPSSSLNGLAPDFVPSASFTIDQPTASPEATLPSHPWANEAEDPSQFHGIPDFEINSSLVDDPFHGEDPFPDIIVPEPTPAPSATGPGQARNAHIQKLNEEVMKREWREKSGMESSADEEEGTAGPEDVLDDMYDRQVTQPLTSPPTRYARGSMFRKLDDLPSPLESVSASSTPSRQSRGSRQGGGNGEEGTGRSSGMPMLGGYEVTRGDLSADSAPEARQEEEATKADGSLVGTGVGEEPKVEEEASGAASRDSSSSPPTTQNIPQQTSPLPRARLPSNYWPQIEPQPKTLDEQVGDAFADHLESLNREHRLGTLKDSIWAPKPEANTAPAPPPSSSPPSVPQHEDPEPSSPQPQAPSSSSYQQSTRFSPLTGSIWANTPASAGSDVRASPSLSYQRGRGRGASLPLPRHLTPTAAAAAPRRGRGRGRRGSPAAAAAARGGGVSSSATNDSFRRQQMARGGM